MNRLLSGACVLSLVFFGGLANAQDFKGFYMGFNAGAAHNEASAQTTTVFSPTGYFASSSVPAIGTAGNQSLSANGFTGGGQVGFNYQHKRLVVGFETDFGALSMSGSKSTTALYPCCAPTSFTVNQSFSTNWLFTARPRLGVAAGPVLLYGTGGIAVTDVQYQERFTDTFATALESGSVKNSSHSGWIAGGGMEVRLSHNWSLKGEFLHAQFGSATTITSTNLTAFTPPIPFPTNVFTHKFGDVSANMGRTGFNFRF